MVVTFTRAALMDPEATILGLVIPLLTKRLPARVVRASGVPRTVKMLAVTAFKFVEKIFVEKIFVAQRLPVIMRFAPRATGGAPTPMFEAHTRVEVFMRLPVNVPFEIKLVDLTLTVLTRLANTPVLVMLADPDTFRVVMPAAAE
jgi:hypothetical protein